MKKKTAFLYPGGRGTVVSVREAKTHLSALIARAARGEEITIAWHGHPRARLAPLNEAMDPLRIDRVWLNTMTVTPRGDRSEDLVRDDRDGRG